MNDKRKNRIKEKLKQRMNRDLKDGELLNMEKDALLLAESALEEIDDLERRILKLEKKIGI